MAAGAKVIDTKYYSSTIDIVFEKSINLFDSNSSCNRFAIELLENYTAHILNKDPLHTRVQPYRRC